MNHKDLIKFFNGMTEEEQKDFLFVLLDCMDFYDEEMKKANGKKKEYLYREYETYEMLSAFFIDPEWQKESGLSQVRFSRRNAHQMREEYEKEIKKA